MVRRSVTRSIRCYHCGHRFGVSGKTESTQCPQCNQRVVVGDIVVKSLLPVKAVQTCGHIKVMRKGSVIAQDVHAGDGLEVQGSLEGNVVCGGNVTIGRYAKWRGDCAAKTVSIADGARIAGGRFRVPQSLEQSLPTPKSASDEASDESAEKPAEA